MHSLYMLTPCLLLRSICPPAENLLSSRPYQSHLPATAVFTATVVFTAEVLHIPTPEAPLASVVAPHLSRT